MSTSSVNIKMSPATVYELKEAGANLYICKSVYSDADGFPVLWMSGDSYSNTVDISWSKDINVYTAITPVPPGVRVITSYVYPIKFHRKLEVDSQTGSGKIEKTPYDTISVKNNVLSVIVTGLAQSSDDSYRPVCVISVAYQKQIDVEPGDKILLMISTRPMEIGTVIKDAIGSGYLIDMNGNSSRTVSYDIEKGWSNGGEDWAKDVSENTDLRPLLIEKKKGE